MTPFAVELSQLAEVVWVSVLAGIAITTSYSLAVYGAGRYLEAQRTGRRAAAVLFAGLAVVCLLAFFGGVIYSVQIMLSK
jgi:Na+-driven multidrug efflux pump